MSRKSYPIDVKRPAFPFGQEFWPNKAEPVSFGGRQRLVDNITALDMKNVLPTPAGYSSFFGTTQLDNLKLPPMTQKVFTYKDSLGNNTLIALGTYGAMLNNDGLHWQESEVPNWVAQTAAGTYEYQPDMRQPYVGFVKCVASFTIPSPLASFTLRESIVQPITNTDEVQDIVVLPIDTSIVPNTYHKAKSITVNYDETQELNHLIGYTNPGITAASLKVGDVYVIVTAAEWASYTVVTGDSVTSTLMGLIIAFNTKATTNSIGVTIEYITDARLRISSGALHSSLAMEYTSVYNASSIPSPAAINYTIDPNPFMFGGIVPSGFNQGTWVADATNKSTGTHSLRSGAILNGQTSTCSLTILQAGTVTFDYNTDSEANYDKLKVFVNSVIMFTTSGQGAGWLSTTITVNQGDSLAFSYIKDGSVSKGADAAWIDNLIVPGGFGVPSVPSIATLLNDQVPVTIPKSSVGNLGYVVFRSPVPLTVGDFSIHRSGGYVAGGAYTSIPGVAPTDDGSLNFTDINLLLNKPYAIPLTESSYKLKQFAGGIQTGLTCEIYDTGLSIGSSILGVNSSSYLKTCNPKLKPSDVVVGRVFTLQSLGQVGSYTAIVGDTISTVIGGVIAAYNLAGTANASVYGIDLITSTALSELYFQPAALVTMTSALTNTLFYKVIDYTMGSVLLPTLADMDMLYSLEFNNLQPSTGVTYVISCDGKPVPVTSNLGAWTNPNFEFTSAQVTAAQLAGTKLLVRINSKRVGVLAIGGTVIGGVGFRFRKVIVGQATMSSHTSPSSTYLSITTPVGFIGYYRVYTSIKLKGLRQYSDVPAVGGTIQLIAPYDTAALGVGNISAPTGALPNTPILDTFQFNAPVLTAGKFSGALVDLADKYSPATVSVTYTHPTTNIAGLSLISPSSLLLGRIGSVAWAITLTPAQEIAFSIINPWTIATIRNRLYCYRNGQGVGTYILRLLLDGTAWEQLLPTFANMAQIEGITAARGRMIMWDTTGSVYTSSVTDPVDFTPALKTRANVAKVDAVRGNIVICLGFKDGYIIYSSASIILATYIGNTTTFKYTTLSNEQGILNGEAVVEVDDAMHFAYTQAGLYAITTNGLQEISIEASTYLKASKLSPRLDYIANRYLSIAFSPEHPSWTVSRWEAFTGAVIPGFPSGTGIELPAPTTNNLTLPKGLYNVNIPQLVGRKFIGWKEDVIWTEGYWSIANDGPLPQSINNGRELVTIPSYHAFTPEAYARLLFNPVYRLQVDYSTGEQTGAPTISDVKAYKKRGLPIPSNVFNELGHIGSYITVAGPTPALHGWTGLPDFITVPALLTKAQILSLAFYIVRVAIQVAQFAVTVSSIVPTAWYAVANITVTSGKVYLSGVVYLNDIYGVPERNPTTGDYIQHNEVLSSTPVLIGTSPLGVVAEVLKAVYSGGEVTTPNNTIVTIGGTPDLMLPGGQFVATQGSSQNPDPIYTKALILDTGLKNWGSCDIPFRTMMDFTPINARAINPITQAITSNAFTYQNLAKTFAIMLQDGSLNLCSQSGAQSVIEFGDIGFSNSGVTRLLDAVASFSTATGATLEVLGSRDGESLSPILTGSVASINGAANIHHVLTGKWFRLRITGRFDLKQLTFSGEPGGNR